MRKMFSENQIEEMSRSVSEANIHDLKLDELKIISLQSPTTPKYLLEKLGLSEYPSTYPYQFIAINPTTKIKFLCSFYKKNNKYYLCHVSFSNLHDNPISCTLDETNSPTGYLTTKKYLYSPSFEDIEEGILAKDHNTLALKSDILTEYRKNKLGNETYTTVSTFQGLIDICDGIIIDEYDLLHIRINSGKFIAFSINIMDLTNLSFTYNNNTYVFGTDFTDVEVDFEGIEVLNSYQEGELGFPNASINDYVGDLTTSYINVIDRDRFINNYHLYSRINIFNTDDNYFTLDDIILSDTQLSMISI